jgi:hypothetical protein
MINALTIEFESFDVVFATLLSIGESYLKKFYLSIDHFHELEAISKGSNFCFHI